MPELPEAANEWYEDSDGNLLLLLWSEDDVYLTDKEDFYTCYDAYICLDREERIQVVPWEYFVKHFRLCSNQNADLFD